MSTLAIVFSAPMVRAILSGSKSQTRRVVKPQPPDGGLEWVTRRVAPDGGPSDVISCPYGQPGDRLWVRETWYCDDYRVQRGPYLKPDDMDVGKSQGDGMLVYRASSGDRPYEAEQPVWRPAIHMPRWASRISLEITSVRVERLQDITNADAKAEGCHHDDPCDHTRRSCAEIGCPGPDYRIGYRNLWEQINGPGSWDANPCVWVVSFRRI